MAKTATSRDRALPRFEMRFEAMTVEHLGLRLYSRLPPVLSELVSNAYDAESAKVDIDVPEGAITPDAEVVVRDYGHGMAAGRLFALPSVDDRQHEPRRTA